MAPSHEGGVLLACTLRFHFTQMARELKSRGRLGKFVTALPPGALGAPELEGHAEQARSNRLVVQVLGRLGMGETQLMRSAEVALAKSVSCHAAQYAGDYSSIIAISGTGLEAGKAVQSAGGRWICDRGASHIQEQDEALREGYEKAGLSYGGIDLRAIERELQEYAAADAVIVPSERVRQSFLKRGVEADRVKVVRLGADLDTFQPRQGVGESDGPLRVLFAGSISVQKGVHHLLQAGKALPGKVELRLAGVVSQDLKPALAEGGASVTHLGKLSKSDLAAEMAQADLFVLPSIQDGFGMVVAEAMACGTPCAVSDGAGASEIVEEGVAGWVFPAGNAEALTAVLEQAAEDRSRLAQMREALAQQRQSLGWSRYGDDLMSVLEEVA